MVRVPWEAANVEMQGSVHELRDAFEVYNAGLIARRSIELDASRSWTVKVEGIE